MWIRRQNKKHLINWNNLGIMKRLNEYVVVSISEFGDLYTIGSYSSEEKALLVLDMIEKVSMYSGNTLFQMPDDDEVEV